MTERISTVQTGLATPPVPVFPRYRKCKHASTYKHTDVIVLRRCGKNYNITKQEATTHNIDKRLLFRSLFMSPRCVQQICLCNNPGCIASSDFSTLWTFAVCLFDAFCVWLSVVSSSGSRGVALELFTFLGANHSGCILKA